MPHPLSRTRSPQCRKGDNLVSLTLLSLFPTRKTRGQQVVGHGGVFLFSLCLAHAVASLSALSAGTFSGGEFVGNGLGLGLGTGEALFQSLAVFTLGVDLHFRVGLGALKVGFANGAADHDGLGLGTRRQPSHFIADAGGTIGLESSGVSSLIGFWHGCVFETVLLV